MGLLGGITGGNDIDKAAKEAKRLGIESKKFADEYMDKSQGLYDPYQQMGMDAWGNVQQQSNNLLNSQVPEAYQFNAGGIQDLYNQYQNQNNVPDYVQAQMPTGPDYAGAANSPLYQQLMQNSQNAVNSNAAGAGLSARGSGAALDIAQAANKNTYDVANQLYQDEMNQYNMTQQNNQYRNQMLNNNLQQGLGVQQMLQQMGQGNYGNQLQSYGVENQNLLNYMNQQTAMGNQGFSATNNLNAAYESGTNSKVGSNAGIAKNQIEAAGAKAQANAALMGSVASVAGAALSPKPSDPRLKDNIQDTGFRTTDGIKYITWTWKPEAKAIGEKYGFICEGDALGVNAEDVLAIRPDLIGHLDGYLAVNYGGLENDARV